MRQMPPRILEPRLAAWLIDLFASEGQAESILGDLHEEFSDLVIKRGSVYARRWYWRQSVKSIFHLTRAAICAPRSIAGVVLFGFLLRWFSATVPGQVVDGILRMQRPYSNLHYGRYVWLLTYGTPLIDGLWNMLIGSIVAVLAKGKELVATITLGIVFAAPIDWLLFLLLARTAPPWRVVPSLASVLSSLAVNILATVFAGVIVRRCRPKAATRLRAT